MLLYQIALFLHLLTLLVAVSASAVTKIAVSRRGRARTLGEVLEWHQVLMSTARAFPLCLVAFVATGGYMLSFTQSSAWTSGFVVAGLVGVALLLVSGTFLGVKGKGFKQMLDRMIAERGPEHAAPKMSPPAMVAALPTINTGIALAVMLDMVVKPDNVLTALAIVAAGILLGVVSGTRAAAARAAASALAPEDAAS